ncbi:hypothetical protein Bbelb_278800 [Branchiostoma belcheri]|nr:hypothetical protein Bbelb_278800 [Branchiostoma belcheri]
MLVLSERGGPLEAFQLGSVVQGRQNLKDCGTLEEIIRLPVFILWNNNVRHSLIISLQHGNKLNVVYLPTWIYLTHFTSLSTFFQHRGQIKSRLRRVNGRKTTRHHGQLLLTLADFGVKRALWLPIRRSLEGRPNKSLGEHVCLNPVSTTAGGYDRGEPRAEAEKLAELVPTEAEPEPAEAPASQASGWAVAGRPGTGTKLFIQH